MVSGGVSSHASVFLFFFPDFPRNYKAEQVHRTCEKKELKVPDEQTLVLFIIAFCHSLR